MRRFFCLALLVCLPAVASAQDTRPAWLQSFRTLPTPAELIYMQFVMGVHEGGQFDIYQFDGEQLIGTSLFAAALTAVNSDPIEGNTQRFWKLTPNVWLAPNTLFAMAVTLPAGVGSEETYPDGNFYAWNQGTADGRYVNMQFGDWSKFDATFRLEDGSEYVLSQHVTPEPATWALMVTGIGAVGLVARRRRRLVS